MIVTDTNISVYGIVKPPIFAEEALFSEGIQYLITYDKQLLRAFPGIATQSKDYFVQL